MQMYSTANLVTLGNSFLSGKQAVGVTPDGNGEFTRRDIDSFLDYLISPKRLTYFTDKDPKHIMAVNDVDIENWKALTHRHN